MLSSGSYHQAPVSRQTSRVRDPQEYCVLVTNAGWLEKDRSKQPLRVNGKGQGTMVISYSLVIPSTAASLPVIRILVDDRQNEIGMGDRIVIQIGKALIA